VLAEQVRRICLDSDALHCLRSLSSGAASLLDLLTAVSSSAASPITVMEFAARHELNSIQVEIASLESKGAIEIKTIERRDLTFRDLIKKGVHKGEAEAIAWILHQRKALRPLFVSRDSGAIRAARTRGVAATDVMGLVVEAIDSEVISMGQARSALVVWDDRSQQICRPADYQGFEPTYARRHNRPPDFYT
jgi:predicted nucleic acid-binding protein